MPTRRHHKPYIPRADGAFRDWLKSFALVAQANASALKLSPPAVAKLADLTQRYEAAYLKRRELRNQPSTAAKNAVRRQAWDYVRPMAMRIKVDRAIPAALKLDLGIYLPHNVKDQARIPPPRLAPVVWVEKAGPGVHRLRYRDAASPSRFAKPPEAVALELFISIVGKGRRPLPAPEARTPQQKRPVVRSEKGGRTRIHTATRHVFDVKFSDGERGRTAWYQGRWVTERGLSGPWSKAMSMVIQ